MSDNQTASNNGCCGCLVGLVALFLIVFLLSHWGQLQDRLAHLLGL